MKKIQLLLLRRVINIPLPHDFLVLFVFFDVVRFDRCEQNFANPRERDSSSGQSNSPADPHWIDVEPIVNLKNSTTSHGDDRWENTGFLTLTMLRTYDILGHNYHVMIYLPEAWAVKLFLRIYERETQLRGYFLKHSERKSVDQRRNCIAKADEWWNDKEMKDERRNFHFSDKNDNKLRCSSDVTSQNVF